MAEIFRVRRNGTCLAVFYADTARTIDYGFLIFSFNELISWWVHQDSNLGPAD